MVVIMADYSFGDLKNAKDKRLEDIIRKVHRTPIGLYTINERLSALVSNPGFLDALLVTLVFLAASASLHFYPVILILAFGILLFGLTVKKPFLGLILLMVLIFPLLMYQMPALSFLFIIIASISLIYGRIHYRTITLIYLLITLSFSQLGYVLAIPMFILGILLIGYKRAILLTLVFVFAVVSLSAISGVQNYSFIVYNAYYAHSTISSQVTQYTTPNRQGFTILTFSKGLSTAYSNFSNSSIANNISSIVAAMITSLGIRPFSYLIELIVLVVLVLFIDNAVIISRSKYHGSKASIIGIGYPAAAVSISIFNSLAPSPVFTIIPFASFLLAPLSIFVLEFFNVSIVKSLDIRKQDLRMKFGEAFEDLESSNVTERFSDIGNYENTKRELKDAVLGPIERKGISKAYNVKPVKGILFFGPPGTGKTMMMRALANEIHAGFYYVKASNLISAFPGETEKMISNIFSIAKKHAPCILFFDEIDSIASSRSNASVSETTRQALSQLLVEMDGFQKTTNVIIVGATNVPNILDKAITRPGRFDKVIYMPPPDLNARKLIFGMYLKKLPISKSFNVDVLAEKTQRYTGADIKVLCESVAQTVAQEAVVKHKVLEINENDILNMINTIKPSVSLAQIDAYNKFRLDFERSVHGEAGEDSREKISVDEDVIGTDEAKKAIYQAVEIPLLHRELVKKYDIKNINGILLFGPPGCGKTLLIKALYNDLKGVSMLEINGADLAEEGIERATASIKETFNRARENAPAIIMLDEAENLILKRSQASEFSSQLTTEMLREIDGINKVENIVVIATTNRPDAIDPAALRPGRFDKLVFVKPPNKQYRAEMFKSNLKKVPLDDDVDFDELANQTSGFTGADISHVCREAKTAALEKSLKSSNEEKVGMDILNEIIKKVKPSAPDSIVAQYLSFYSKYGER